MFLLATVATAQTGALSWPCTRLNWAWRNVWSTCSINSYVPTNANNDPLGAPSHFRSAPLDTPGFAPSNALAADGTFNVPSQAAGVPQMLCTALPATHGGTSADYAQLRNRCRRALDAYGGLVATCRLTPLQGARRGPVASSFYTNWEPLNQHEPHNLNVNRLRAVVHACTTNVVPGVFQSPASTCPGLLGWWTVVWNACGFRTYAPQAGGANDAANAPAFAPLGGELSPRLFYGVAPLEAAPGSGTAPGLVFCSPITTAGPNSWNQRGAAFRTTRCRRALDQFGRTAWRCGGTAPTVPTGSPARGASDQLRNLMLGRGSASAPSSLSAIAPLCN